jgi:hypothetical protein
MSGALSTEAADQVHSLPRGNGFSGRLRPAGGNGAVVDMRGGTGGSSLASSRDTVGGRYIPMEYTVGGQDHHANFDELPNAALQTH